MQQVVTFPSGQVKYLFNSSIDKLWDIYRPNEVVFITDKHIAAAYPAFFKEHKSIVLAAGEGSKTLETVGHIVEKLLTLQATRDCVLIGFGGGVITDITGFVASVYMRGVRCAFIPTTVLGMADAAIGGKNGVNNGMHKNITGTIRQPECLLYDISLLQTLPHDEWSNGFAEVIKYACLFDAELFKELISNNINFYKTNAAAMQQVITRCADWKNRIVANDEHEKGMRKLLNFGHTAAHAIENLYEMPHGQAVAIGMVIAATLSEQITGLTPGITLMLKDLLQQYDLPVNYKIDTAQAMHLLKMDKKRHNDTIDFILLEDIGQAVIKPLSLDIIENAIARCTQ